MAKKQVSKKRAAEGRGVKCRNCYTNMKIHLTLEGGEDYICERCGLRWILKQGRAQTEEVQ